MSAIVTASHIYQQRSTPCQIESIWELKGIHSKAELYHTLLFLDYIGNDLLIDADEFILSY